MARWMKTEITTRARLHSRAVPRLILTPWHRVMQQVSLRRSIHCRAARDLTMYLPAGSAYVHPSPLQSESSAWQYPGSTIAALSLPQYPSVHPTYPPRPSYMPFNQPASSADVAPFHSTYAPRDLHSSSPYTPTTLQPMWQTNLPFQHVPQTQPYANESAFASPTQPYANESAFAPQTQPYANESAFALPPLMMPGQRLGLGSQPSPHAQQFWHPQYESYDASRPESSNAAARRAYDAYGSSQSEGSDAAARRGRGGGEGRRRGH